MAQSSSYVRLGTYPTCLNTVMSVELRLMSGTTMMNTECRSSTALNTVWINSLQQPWILIHGHKEVHEQCVQRVQKRFHFFIKTFSVPLQDRNISLHPTDVKFDHGTCFGRWNMNTSAMCHFQRLAWSTKIYFCLFFLLTRNMYLILPYVSYSSRFSLSHEYFSCPFPHKSHAVLGFNIFETLLTGS